ncbi:hypothetical protein EB1_25240 [Empedobacter brevis NBRC 14943 = ATCC 43319]|uniref:Uncharacterized protein n=1 Tax=Empedobacter brevis NBRC 14943 = ATCC 43319 TaxID=1218108 RepID=A0A511NIZ2_9FLAO|nr:DUF6520 family protein [Empedobacter brevis]GEM52734.1 hypothetical protein EB1_25240 [Empedobacter brevis NBRC 14943 = ATCC 43319]
MRTKFLKIGLPAMAFLAAGVFAFATEKNEASTEAFAPGYIFQSGQCLDVPMECNNLGGLACTFSGQQVFQIKASATSCSNPLTHRVQ